MAGELRRWDGTGWVSVLTEPTFGQHGHSAADVSGLVTNLDELSDVTVTSPVTGNVIRWSGAQWVNATLAVGDVSGLSAALAAKADLTELNLIGGGNLWTNSGFEGASYFAGWTVYSNDGASTASSTTGRLGGTAARISWSLASSQAQGVQRPAPGGFKTGTPYTLSWWAKGSGSPVGKFFSLHNNPPAPTSVTWRSNPALSSSWQRYVVSFYRTDTNDPIFWGINNTSAGTNQIDFDDVQLEEGWWPTAYAPAGSEIDPPQLTASLRAQAVATGGGTVTVTGFAVKWTQRFIVISNGKGSHFTTDGHFNIDMPAVSTVITGVGGATDKTVVADGIPLNSWDAIYYILPVGASSTFRPENLRVVSHTANVTVPETWVMIAIRGESGQFRFIHGATLTNGQTWVATDAANTVLTTGTQTITGAKTFTANGLTLPSQNTYFANPGVGVETKLSFLKSSDGAWVSVNEFNSDQTLFRFGMSDNPDSWADAFQWHMVNWEGGSLGWTPLHIAGLATRIQGYTEHWGPLSLPTATPYYTTGNSDGTGDTVLKSAAPSVSTTANIVKQTGTGTGTFNINPVGYTTANFTTSYWVQIDAADTSKFNWGKGAGAAIGSGIAITGDWQTLDNGVQVKLSLTLHAASDMWKFRVWPSPVLALNDAPIRLRGRTDDNHEIRWVSGVDGPRIKGALGGELGYGTAGSFTQALKWDATGVTLANPINNGGLPTRLRAEVSPTQGGVATTDPNLAVENGYYYVNNVTTNAPPGAVTDYYLHVVAYNSQWVAQTAFDARTNRSWVRYKQVNAWGAWITADHTPLTTKLSSDAPNTYPIGLSTVEATLGQGWPRTYGSVITSYININRAQQTFQSKPEREMWFRAADGNAWQAWQRVVTDDDSRLVTNPATTTEVRVAASGDVVRDPYFTRGSCNFGTVYASTDGAVPQTGVPEGNVVNIAKAYDLFEIPPGSGQPIPVTPGEKFLITARVAHTGTGTTSLGLRLWFQTHDSYGAGGTGWTLAGGSVTTSTAQDAWTDVSFVVTVPATSTSGVADKPIRYAHVGVGTGGPQGDDGWWIANYRIRRVASGPTLDIGTGSTQAAAGTHTHGVSDLTATGTRDATTFLRGDNTWAAPDGGDPIAPITLTEPAGAPDGLLWYDSDLELDDPEVYVQPDEPIGVPEGTLWFDSDEVAHQPIDGSTDIIDATVTEAKLSTGVQTKLNAEKVAIQIDAADKGVWSNTSAYVKGDVVGYQGKSWVATQAVAAYVVAGNDPLLSGMATSATVSGSAITVTIPATVAVGDEMLIIVGNYSSTWATSNIAGGSAGAWTVLSANQSSSSTYTTYSSLLRKVAAAGDPGATLTISGLNGSYAGVDFRAYRYATYSNYAFVAQNGVSTIPTPALSTAGRGITVHAAGSMTNTSGVQTLTVDTALSSRQNASSGNYFVIGSGHELRTAAAAANPMPSRTFTSTAAGGFGTWAIGYTGTRTTDANTFDTNVWQELPFSSNSGRWELAQVLTPVGSSATAANCRFDNIPTKYRKLRVECDGLNTSVVTSGHVYMTFNSSTSFSYLTVSEYRSTGAYSVTNNSTLSYAYAAFNYFYTGTGRRNRFRVDVLNDTLTQPTWESDLWSLTGAGGYVYRSKCDGAWNSTAKITRIEFATSNGGSWNCEQPIYLYGWVD